MNSAQIKSDITAWIDNAGRCPLLPAERVNKICKEIQSLPEQSVKRKKLINKVVSSNLLLVVRFVNVYMRTSSKKWESTETVDYLQAGSIGLIRAVEKYDPARGYAFSTYANYWIRSEVGRYHFRNLTPVYVSESVTRQIQFYNRNGYMKAKYDDRLMTKEKAEEIKARATVAYNYVSLDKPNEIGTNLIDSLVDEKNTNTIDNIRPTTLEALEAAGVTEIGQYILIEMFINGRTALEISTEMGISYDRIKREKKLALECAQKRPDLFESGIL